MARRRKSVPFDQIAQSYISDILDPELLTLRLHASMEAFLYHLLAAGRRMPESEVPQLSLHQLSALALPGDENRELRSALAKLTELRNQVAHSLEPLGYTRAMQEFAVLLYPEAPASVAGTVEQYREGLRRLVFSIGLYAKFAIEGGSEGSHTTT